MKTLLILVSVLASLSALVFGLYYIINVVILYAVHKEMVMHSTKEWGYSNYSTFLENYKKRTWEQKRDHPESHFHYSTNSQIHASIICFDNKGMVLDFISFLRFLRWEKRNTLKGYPTINWTATL